MTLPELAKRLRLLLSHSSEESEINDFLNVLDDEIRNATALDDDDQQRRDFEEELQNIYGEDVDFYQLQTVEVFLDVLVHSRPILPATTVISNWFEVLIRPALRDPRLRLTAVEHAKQLVIEALEEDEQDPDMVKNFRRRLVDLFLLDAFNESSGKDILEWAQLDDMQKSKNIWWKDNLEEILIRHGLSRPTELMDIMQDCFEVPSSRLRIVTLLDCLAAESSFPDIAPEVFAHPFMGSIYRSLEVDNSSTVCAVELSLLVKLLPVATITAYLTLRGVLPRLYGILGRVLCWRAALDQVLHGEKVPYSALLDYEDKEPAAGIEESVLEEEVERLQETRFSKLEIREDLNWIRLERTFDLSTRSLPVPKQFFGLLYCLFPCNTIHFLRNAAEYLQQRSVDSPWTVGWKDALDGLQIRTAGKTLLRSYLFNPGVLNDDVDSELSNGERWSEFDVSRIIGECMMLDSEIRGLSSQESVSSRYLDSTSRPVQKLRRSGDITTTQTPTLKNVQLEEIPPRQRKVSLHDLIATSVALKSGADIHVSEKAPAWPSILFTPPPSTVPSTTPSRSSSVDPSMTSEAASPTDELRIPTQISETIAGLQREVLLLRTELNFELWLKRENIRHIGRLHRDDVLTKSAENEQQRLQERLRDYRTRLQELQKEMKKHQDQTLKNKKDTAEWSEELTSKLNDLRTEKKAWLAKANALRSENADLQAQLAAQSKLLDEAQNRVFELEAQIKADAPKVNRLRDYEKRIEQLTAMLRLWNKDINQYNEQAKEMAQLLGEHQKMKLRVEGYEKALADADADVQKYRYRIQSLEVSLRTAKRVEPQRRDVEQMLSEQANQRSTLEKSNKALREENEQLRIEMDDLRAQLEVLNAKANGLTGLISPITHISA
ncbi:hypothetical protein ACEPAG_5183 [Sanghuangporus baumii]